jgi:hypothetical protein
MAETLITIFIATNLLYIHWNFRNFNTESDNNKKLLDNAVLKSKNQLKILKIHFIKKNTSIIKENKLNLSPFKIVSQTCENLKKIPSNNYVELYYIFDNLYNNIKNIQVITFIITYAYNSTNESVNWTTFIKNNEVTKFDSNVYLVWLKNLYHSEFKILKLYFEKLSNNNCVTINLILIWLIILTLMSI